MEPILGRRIFREFRHQFPLYGARVVKWRPSSLFEVKLWLNDNTLLYFSHTGRRSRLWSAMKDKKKGRLIYDSKADNRKGV